MNLGDLLTKFMPGAAVVTAAVTACGVAVFSPYSPMRPKPDMCAERQTCVIVVGLDDDVNIGVGAEGQAIGFDLNDEVTRRLVDWVERAPNGVRVYKMPEEIAMPERGLANYDRTASATMARAREIGRTYHANLVVMGQVTSANSVSLAFVNPNDGAATLTLGEYELPTIGMPENFLDDFGAAIDAAREARPAPIPIAATIPAPISRNRPTEPETLPAPTPSLTPETTFTQPSDPGPTAQTTVAATFRNGPSRQQMQDAYPSAALRREIPGRAVVRCFVNLDGSLHTCRAISQEPEGMGFGAAAEELARRHTTAFPQIVNGQPVADGPVEVPYVFRVRSED